MCAGCSEKLIIMINFLILLLTNIVKMSSQDPIILDNSLTTCNYPIANEKKEQEATKEAISFTSKIWTAKNNDIQLNFSFCGKLGSHLEGVSVPYSPGILKCMGYKGCLMSRKGVPLGHFGANFTLGYIEYSDNLIATFSHGSPCKYDRKQNYTLKISLIKSDIIPEKPTVEKVEKCTFHLRMLHPMYEPKCTLRYMGQLIDLRQLKKRYFITTPKRNFSVTLCDTSSSCEMPGVNSCEIINNKFVPLSTYESQVVQYKENTHQLVIVGHTHKEMNNNKRIDKRMEIALKCNLGRGLNLKYDMNLLKYKEVPTQGKSYHFELETSYGCIKNQKPSSDCILYDPTQMFIYNLTDLYYEHIERWTVKEMVEGILFLNVCGPLDYILKYPPTIEREICTDTFAQVCHVTPKNEYINKGFVLSHLMLDGDTVRAFIEDGFNCKENNSLNYRTEIDFACNEKERGPTYSGYTDCTTHIYWRTPQACPRYNKEECKKVPPQIQNCSFVFNGDFYDLTPLIRFNSSYSVLNKYNSTEYLLNVCTTVYDESNPCLRDTAVARKRMEWVNPKYRVVSAGKLSGDRIHPEFVNNKSFIVTHKFGTYCRDKDYESQIRFECSDVEDLTIIYEDSCFTTFLWRTKHACAVSTVGKKQCVFSEPVNKNKFDFTNLSQTSINVSLNEMRYVFDICSNNFTECYNGCSYVLLKNSTLSSNNESYYVNMVLPRSCESQKGFNKVEFNLVCDSITANEHFVYEGVKDCVLNFKFITNKACGKTLKSEKVEPPSSSMEPPSTSMEPLSRSINCSIENTYTGFKYSLSTVENDSKVPIHFKCPIVTYNNSQMYVKLTYLSDDCPKSEEQGVFYHKILLHCSTANSSHHSEDRECYQTYEYKSTDFCKFFTGHSSSTIGWAVRGILCALFGIIALFIGLSRFRHRSICIPFFRTTVPSYSTIYLKEGDL